jgi:hypothetical protein
VPEPKLTVVIVNVTVAPSFTEVELGAIAKVRVGVTGLVNPEVSELTP